MYLQAIQYLRQGENQGELISKFIKGSSDDFMPY